MKLIIELSEEEYAWVKRASRQTTPLNRFCVKAIANGVSLPKGHNENNDYADCDQFVCSECGIELQDWHRVERDVDDGDITYHEYTFRYCPNCGAKIEDNEEGGNANSD